MSNKGKFILLLVIVAGIIFTGKSTVCQGYHLENGMEIWGINLNQVSLSNWLPVEIILCGFNLQFNYFANYKKLRHLWNSRLELDYGLNKTKSDGSKKTNDKIYLSSLYGYELRKNLYLSGLMTFQSQFAKGYDYSTDPRTYISRFMSPVICRLELV